MIKQRLLFVLFFTINLTTLFAQNSVNKLDESGKRHGVWQKTYPKTKQLRYSGQFLHGKEIDTFKYYKLKNKKSVLSATKVFNADNAIAEVTFFTSKGKIVSKGKMNGKKFIGEWNYFHNTSDTIMIEEFYNDNGMLDGERNVFFSNGILAEVTSYKNGQKSGSSKIYSESGKLLQESLYKDDKLNGKSIYYANDGKIRAEGHFKSNLKTGVWNYYKDGDLIRKVNHDDNTVIFKKQ